MSTTVGDPTRRPWCPVLLTGFCLVSEDMSVRYRERLSVPLRWWVQATMFLATLWLAFIVSTPPWLAWTATGACFADWRRRSRLVPETKRRPTFPSSPESPKTPLNVARTRADPAAPARHP